MDGMPMLQKDHMTRTLTKAVPGVNGRPPRGVGIYKLLHESSRVR